MKNQFINIDLMPEYIAKPSFINFQFLFSLATLGIIGFFFVYLPILDKQNETNALHGELTYLTNENTELATYYNEYTSYQDYENYLGIIDYVTEGTFDLVTRVNDIEDKLDANSSITRVDYSLNDSKFVINLRFDNETRFYDFYWSLYDIDWVDSIAYQSLNVNPDNGDVSTIITIEFSTGEVDG